MLSPLWGIYTLRNADTHLPPKDIKEAYELCGIDIQQPMVIQGYQLIHYRFFTYMKTSRLTLSKKDVADYCLKNKYATNRFHEAARDYSAARCLILNALFPGFELACQAIEKILKAFIYLETGEEPKLKFSHKPFKLKEELKEVKDHELDKYDDLLKILYEHYQSRYHENPTSGRGASGKELVEIDNLWIYLVEILPMPDEVKYGMKFFHDLCDVNARIYWHDYKWLIQDNKALIPKLVK